MALRLCSNLQADHPSQVSFLLAKTLPLVICCFCILSSLALFGCASQSSPTFNTHQEASASPTETSLTASSSTDTDNPQANRSSDALTWVDLDNISLQDDQSFSTFALLQQHATSTWTPTLTTQQVSQLQAALTALESYGTQEDADLAWDPDALEDSNAQVGFAFINLNTGCGICYNLDQPIYGASSVKASFAAYVCQRFLDENATDYSSPSTSAFYDRALISNIISYSDNDDFITLHSRYKPAAYTAWCQGMGIYDIAYSDNDDFSTFSTRSLLQVWLNINDYLLTDSETAQWFADLLSHTNRSEIRTALADLDDITVYNKAGWIAEDPFNATVDGALIVDEDQRYLMCIMTNLPCSEASSNLVSQLAANLYDCRDSLS